MTIPNAFACEIVKEGTSSPSDEYEKFIKTNEEESKQLRRQMEEKSRQVDELRETLESHRNEREEYLMLQQRLEEIECSRFERRDELSLQLTQMQEQVRFLEFFLYFFYSSCSVLS